MNAPLARPLVFHPPGDSELAHRLRGAVQGEVLFDRGSRGRYATDASIYQIEPVGVLVPRTHDDVRAAVDICRELGVPLLPRGGGSSEFPRGSASAGSSAAGGFEGLDSREPRMVRQAPDVVEVGDFQSDFRREGQATDEIALRIEHEPGMIPLARQALEPAPVTRRHPLAEPAVRLSRRHQC